MPEQVQGETPTTPIEQPKPEASETHAPDLSAELATLKAKLSEVNKESAARRKRLEELEGAEAKRKEAEMTETEKLSKQLQETQTRLKAYERSTIQRQAATKFGLPEALVSRLQGETLEEMEADAKALADTLTKAPKASAGAIPNPGGAGSVQETEAQKRERLFGKPPDIWSPDFGKDNGGGFFISGG